MTDDLELKKIVGEIAAAYFGNSHVTPTEIATVISQIASSIAAVGAPASEAPAETPAQSKLTPAQIRRSITRDAIISFEDNKPYKTMRRHLASRGMTPDDYRTKWGLPRDYPMVAPSYSEARSNLAKERGLGGRVRANAPAAAAQPAATAETAPAAAAAEGGPAPARQRPPSRARRASPRAAAAQAAPGPSVQSSGSAPAAEGGAKSRRRSASGRTRRGKKAPGAADNASS